MFMRYTVNGSRSLEAAAELKTKQNSEPRRPAAAKSSALFSDSALRLMSRRSASLSGPLGSDRLPQSVSTPLLSPPDMQAPP